MSDERVPGYVTGMTPAVRRRKVVLKNQDGRCVKCRRQLVDIVELKEEGNEIISFNSRSVRWMSQDGRRHESLIATVDHVISKREWAERKLPGSPHQITNLAVLCDDCHRTKSRREVSRCQKRIKGVCYKCSGPCEPNKKKCIVCRTGTQHPIRDVILREYEQQSDLATFSPN